MLPLKVPFHPPCMLALTGKEATYLPANGVQLVQLISDKIEEFDLRYTSFGSNDQV